MRRVSKVVEGEDDDDDEEVPQRKPVATKEPEPPKRAPSKVVLGEDDEEDEDSEQPAVTSLPAHTTPPQQIRTPPQQKRTPPSTPPHAPTQVAPTQATSPPAKGKPRRPVVVVEEEEEEDTDESSEDNTRDTPKEKASAVSVEEQDNSKGNAEPPKTAEEVTSQGNKIEETRPRSLSATAEKKYGFFDFSKADKAGTLTDLERRAKERNESLRKTLGTRLGQVYEQITRELVQASAPMKTVLALTQEASKQVKVGNQDFVTLLQAMDSCTFRI